MYAKYMESRRTNTFTCSRTNPHTLQNDNPHNPTNLGDEIDYQLPPPVDAHNRVLVENPGEGYLRRQPPASRPQEYYRGNVSITDSNGPLVLPSLPHGHTFVVTSTLIQILTPLEVCFRGYLLRIHMLTSPK